jgi:hypothetical protein
LVPERRRISMVLQRVEADLKEDAVQGPKVRLMSQADDEGCPVGCGLACRDRKESVRWGQDVYGKHDFTNEK